MPKTTTDAFKTHLQNGGLFTWYLKITLNDNPTPANRTVLGRTAFNRDLSYDSVTYKATKGLNPFDTAAGDDMAPKDSATRAGYETSILTQAKLLGGIADGAEYEYFIANPHDESMGRVLLKKGELGRVQLDDFSYEWELRDILELINQKQGAIYSETCRSKLGFSFAEAGDQGGCRNPDNSTGVTLSDYTFSGTVDTPDSTLTQNKFTCTDISGTDVQGNTTDADSYFDFGKLTWTSGNNSGLEMEVRTHTHSGSTHTIELRYDMLVDITANDAFDVHAGCDKKLSGDCKNKFNNTDNNQSEPNVPGRESLQKAPNNLDGQPSDL